MRQHNCKLIIKKRLLIHLQLCCRITTLTITFLTNFKISDFNKEYMSSLKMI